jgi:predicted MPP superfamily phosphohydrolase
MFSRENLMVMALALLGVAFVIVALSLLRQRWAKLPKPLGVVLAGVLILLVAGYATGVYGTLVAPNQLAVRQVSVLSPHWHGAPLKIAVLGDVALASPSMGAARLEDVIGRIDDAHPDIVILLGGYVGGPTPAAERSDAEREDIARGFTAYALLNAPMGVIGVLGPSDLGFGGEATTRALEDTGVAVLSNRSVAIAQRGVNLAIAGAAPREPDIADALDSAPNGDVIVIAHDQAVAAQAPSASALVLTMCGAGPCGLRTLNTHAVFAAESIAAQGFRLKPPEIVVINLRAQASVR